MDPVRQLVSERPRFTEAKPAIDWGYEEAKEIHPGIYMSEGITNSYMVVTGDSRVIINTGMGFECKLVHKRLFDAVSTAPVSHIITTQGHVDLVGGVGQHREDATVYIAQQNNASCQHDDELIQKGRSSQAYIWFRKTIDASIKVIEENPDAMVQDQPTPDLTFDNSHSFEQGGVKFELYSTPGGETIDSCIVWLPDEKVVFTGNQVGPLFPHFPNLNTIRGDKYRWCEPYMASVKRLRDLGAEKLVTGHFQPIVGKELIHECLTRLHDAVEYVFTETLKGVNDGKTLWQLMREITLPEHLYVGQGYGKVSWAVRTIFEAHMGWFKGDLTSELYATRPHDVMADMVGMLGTDVVLETATGKHANGDAESALLLCEAILLREPAHEATRVLYEQVHRTLLAEMEAGEDNFWLGGWLRHRVGEPFTA